MVNDQSGSFRAKVLSLALVFGSFSVFVSPAKADTPLNRAVVQSIRNTVQLLLQNKSPRSARVKDALIPGDALSTAQASLAELRFNDGSLARVGERALFRFLPQTRSFQLSNGTVLLLIPPKQGRTRITTPNASAGIRGSALFVRYLPETDTTLIGALTNSGIEVSNRDQSQLQPLAAGQLAVVVKDKITDIYNFNLRTFYETSEISRGLNLSRPEAVSADASIAAVQAETIEAVENQGFVSRLPSERVAPLSLQAIILEQKNLLQRPAFEQLSTISTVVGTAGSDQNRSVMTEIMKGGSGAVGRPDPSPRPARIPMEQPDDRPGVGGNSNAPGQAGTAPGLAGTTPGQGGDGPPGQTGTAPGRSGDTPGQLRRANP